MEMSDDDVLALIREAIREVAPERAAMVDRLSLESPVQELELDSVGVVEMIAYIEDRVACLFRPSDIMRLRKLRDVAVLIRSDPVPAAGNE